MLASGELWSRHYREKGSYVLDWKRAARFRVSADGRRVKCRPYPRAARVSIRILRGLVRSCVRSLRGAESLHATALKAPGSSKALAILGVSGTGKSTLAAALIRRGWRLLCDDTLAFRIRRDGIRVRAGAARLKLSDLGPLAGLSPAADREYDPNLEKWVLHFPRPEGSYPLAAIVLLRRSARGETRLQRIKGARAAAVLQSSFYNELLRPPSVLNRQFDCAARLAGMTPVWTLRYPSGFQYLAGACSLLESYAANLG